MIDSAILRGDPERVKRAVASKRTDPTLVDAFLELDEKWRKGLKELEDIRARQNHLAKNWTHATEAEKAESKTLKDQIKKLEESVAEFVKERDLIWSRLPNIPSDDTPVGKDENDNKIIRTWGEPKKFDFEPKDHMALGEALGIIDTEQAAKVSGARFGYLKGGAALLEFALVQFAFETFRNEEVLRTCADAVEKGYSAKPFVPVIPPVMIRSEVYRRTGRLTSADEEEKYYIPSDDIYMIGSAEHTLAPLHMDETLREEALPIRYAGFSTSFRREAGSYGKDMKGILRVHQFDKVEMESFTVPEDSVKEQEFLVRMQEYLMQQLGLPYQVVSVCTGDMGTPDYRQIDIETWLPGQNKYRETHSSDNVTDYQARRLRTKVARKEGKEELVHMNDATAFAIGRTLIAIIENYQTKEGKIDVPAVLQKYVGQTQIG
jgi:seryl-tRNA synthetase